MKFRDVSRGLQILRDILLGRKHTLHNRFPPLMAPRTIPPADIPRGPEYKYSNQYYFARSAFESVKPPVVAPVAQGPPLDRDPTQKAGVGGMRPDCVCFSNLPTPGWPWWWDGHCYYECDPDPPPPCTPPPCDCPPCPEPQPVCWTQRDFPPPCPRSPDSGPRH